MIEENLREEIRQEAKVRHRFRFDGRISYGHILIMLGMVFTACGLWVNTQVKLNTYDLRIIHIENLATAQTNTLRQITSLQRSMQMIQVQQTDAINQLEKK